MNWNSPLAEELETEAVGLRPDSTWAVASRYWKSAPVWRAALRIAPMTAAPCVPVLSTNIRLGLPGRLPLRWVRIVGSYGKRTVNIRGRIPRYGASLESHGGCDVGRERGPPQAR